MQGYFKNIFWCVSLHIVAVSSILILWPRVGRVHLLGNRGYMFQDVMTDRARALDIVGQLGKGETIYGIVKSVSSSGMSRRIKFYAIKDNRPMFLSWSISQLLGYKLQDDGTIRVNGVGMDMIFATVYELGAAVHSDGYYFRSDSL